MADAPLNGEPPFSRLGAEASTRAREVEELLSAGADDEVLLPALDRFHAACFAIPGAPAVSCAPGCASCCSQMVTDVHAHEIERIGLALIESGRGSEVLDAVERRDARFRRLRVEHPRRPGEHEEAWTERMLVEFWKLDLPCALLDREGRCTVHRIRPWACRRHFALGDPALCRGDRSEDPRRGGFLLEPVADLDERLARRDLEVGFDPQTDRLDQGLERWLRRRTT